MPLRPMPARRADDSMAGRWPLRRTLATSLAVAALVPMLVATTVSARRTATQRIAAAGIRLQETAAALCEATTATLDTYRTGIVNLASSVGPVPEVPTYELAARLATFHQHYPGFVTLLAARRDGILVAAHPTTIGGMAMADGRRHVADRDYFRDAMARETPIVTNAFLGRGVGRDPIVAISAPVLGTDGRPTGIVEGSLDMRIFEQVGNRFARSGGATFVLLDRARRVVYSSASLAMPPLTRAEDVPALASLAGRGGRGDATIDRVPSMTNVLRGTSGEMLGAGCRTRDGWEVLMRLPVAPLARDLREQLVTAAGFTLGAMLLALGTAGALARRVTHPLEELAAMVRTYRAGAPPPRVAVGPSAPTEVALLVRHFDGMAERVDESDRDLRDALEQSHRLQAELAAVVAARDAEVRARTAELLERSLELAAASAALDQLAGSDALTGLANRRGFEMALERSWHSAVREGATVALLLVDVDHFKRFNDTYGHVIGDACLREVAHAVLALTRRPLDVAARYGGEELAVLMHGSSVAAAEALAERIRASVAALRIPVAAGRYATVTVSIGVAAAHPNGVNEPSHLVSVADVALYRAKSLGRDRVVVADDLSAAASLG